MGLAAGHINSPIWAPRQKRPPTQSSRLLLLFAGLFLPSFRSSRVLFMMMMIIMMMEQQPNNSSSPLKALRLPSARLSRNEHFAGSSGKTKNTQSSPDDPLSRLTIGLLSEISHHYISAIRAMHSAIIPTLLRAMRYNKMESHWHDPTGAERVTIRECATSALVTLSLFIPQELSNMLLPIIKQRLSEWFTPSTHKAEIRMDTEVAVLALGITSAPPCVSFIPPALLEELLHSVAQLVQQETDYHSLRITCENILGYFAEIIAPDSDFMADIVKSMCKRMKETDSQREIEVCVTTIKNFVESGREEPEVPPAIDALRSLVETIHSSISFCFSNLKLSVKEFDGLSLSTISAIGDMVAEEAKLCGEEITPLLLPMIGLIVQLLMKRGLEDMKNSPVSRSLLVILCSVVSETDLKRDKEVVRTVKELVDPCRSVIALFLRQTDENSGEFDAFNISVAFDFLGALAEAKIGLNEEQMKDCVNLSVWYLSWRSLSEEFQMTVSRSVFLLLRSCSRVCTDTISHKLILALACSIIDKTAKLAWCRVAFAVDAAMSALMAFIIKSHQEDPKVELLSHRVIEALLFTITRAVLDYKNFFYTNPPKLLGALALISPKIVRDSCPPTPVLYASMSLFSDSDERSCTELQEELDFCWRGTMALIESLIEKEKEKNTPNVSEAAIALIFNGDTRLLGEFAEATKEWFGDTSKEMSIIKQLLDQNNKT